MKGLLLALAVLAVVGLGYIRLAPSDPARWHVDPLTAEPPGPAGVLRAPGTRREAPVWAVEPEVLMVELERVILATPRARLLAGSVEEGFATYVVRSRIFGFPDYVSVRVLPAEGGATVAVYSRLRFGRGDMGVNARRLEGWLAELSSSPDLPLADATPGS